MKEKKLTYIIATRYGSEYLELLLESIARGSTTNTEIIIVADRPSWQTLKLLQDKGFTLGINYFIVDFGHLDRTLDHGVQFATNEYVCFCCDDIVLQKNFDGHVLECFLEGDEENCVVIPAYYNSNTTTSPTYRYCGYPEFKYNELYKSFKHEKFSWDAFDKLEVSMEYALRFCGSPPVEAISKTLYNRIGGLTFCSPHPQGHEIEMVSRATKRYHAKQIRSLKALFLHFGGGGNADAQRFAANDAGSISPGWFKCSICGNLDKSEGNVDHFVSERSKILLKLGKYLCDRCKKDGYVIHTDCNIIEKV